MQKLVFSFKVNLDANMPNKISKTDKNYFIDFMVYCCLVVQLPAQEKLSPFKPYTMVTNVNLDDAGRKLLNSKMDNGQYLWQRQTACLVTKHK